MENDGVCCYHVTYAFYSEPTLMTECQETRECGFTLKLIRDMLRTYSSMHQISTHNTAQPFGQFG